MKRLLKYTLAALAAIFVLPTAFLCGLYLTADMEQPEVLRTEHELSTNLKKKVALFCNVDENKKSKILHCLKNV